MTTKKSAAKKSAAKNGKNGKGPPVNKDGEFVLTEIMLLKLRVADAECRMALGEMEVASGRVAKAIEAAPEVQKAILDQNLALGRISVRKADREFVYTTICELFGIEDLTLYSIDDKTGVVTLKPVEKAEPVKGKESPKASA